MTLNSWLKDLIGLTVIFLIIFGSFLGTRPLMAPDEGRYAEIPREMVADANYTTPHLDGVKYFEKPPLFYWMERAAIKLWGVNEWSLRLMPALMGIFGCFIVYYSTRKLFNRRCALLGSLMLATSTLYCTMAHYISPDLTLAVLLSAALFAFILGTREPIGWSRTFYMWAMYAGAALAVLTKGLIGIIFPGMIIFIWLLVTQRWRDLKTYCLPTGILLFCLIALPWHIWVQFKNPEFFKFYFLDQQFLRYLTDYAKRGKPGWFFPATVLIGFFPWICFSCAALCSYVGKNFLKANLNWRECYTAYLQHPEMLFLIIWFFSIFVFFLLSHSLLISYAVPLMLPLAVLTAYYLDNQWAKKQTRTLTRCFIAFLSLAIIAAIVGFFITHPHTVGHSRRIYWYLSLLLVGFSGIIAYYFYSHRGLKAGFIAIVISFSLSLISLNVSYATLDFRSIKPLAMTLKPLLTPSTEVMAFRQYYQDLPVYLQRKITVVNYQGELAFGILHQNARNWMLTEDALWKKWQDTARLFMIMSINDYNSLKLTHPTLYPIAKTQQNILVTNQPWEQL